MYREFQNTCLTDLLKFCLQKHKSDFEEALNKIKNYATVVSKIL